MDIVFTDREQDIMNVLWDHGALTAAEVRERLADDLAYNTVLTMLRILEEKGYVRHTEKGRAHVYHAAVERQAAATSAVRRLVRKVFRGSPELLVMQLAEDRALDDETVRRLRALLDERLGEDER
ncbi:MAG TPA: BlaI/MecI/CopY family transcriptional regulator [Longimicrobium sp.]|nr:BlaI/MecI/CopY family transcriptional regulator [Longimicrobium sp.]